MTAADVGRFALIVLLGFLAFLIFLLAGTILALMWLDSSHCNCYHLPAGIYVLAAVGLLIFGTLISEAIEHTQPVFEGLVANQREALILLLIFALFVLLILL